MFVHGWPGSFLEAKKILPLLEGGEGRVAFDVVVPSLPNYGFSGGVKKVSFEKTGEAKGLMRYFIARV